MSKEHEECRHCSHCKRCRANCFKKHQTPEDKTFRSLKAKGDSKVVGLRKKDKTSGDFCLSDMDEDTGFYRKRDVKEFVRRLKAEFKVEKDRDTHVHVKWINKVIDKLAGSKLV